MSSISFTAAIEKFSEKGEKSGWTYIAIPAEMAEKMKPGSRKSFRVKGKLDKVVVQGLALLPMGGGDFILPLNASLRKSLAKREGAMVKLQLQEDSSAFVFNQQFLECLADEPTAATFFQSLPGSHQRYFSKWIDEAKTVETRVKRIAMAVNALARRMGYGEMLRSAKEDRSKLGY